MDKVLATRIYLDKWENDLKEQIMTDDSSLMQTYKNYFADDPQFLTTLKKFAHTVSHQLEPVVIENNQDLNLPQLQQYNAIGERIDEVIHHPSYIEAGDYIYGSNLMSYLSKPGKMLKTLSLFLLSSHAGEAGHNCPIACSAGVIRVLSNYKCEIDVSAYLQKLVLPSFTDNFTGAQFLTEIQGGSDVGSNEVTAKKNQNGEWIIQGEKWFCSNANADLILLTARFDPQLEGTKGLGLFLIPKTLPNGERNHFFLRRLKQKFGTRSMATAEIDFRDAIAYPVGDLQRGINIVMENVLHISRIFNAFSVCGMSRRAFQIAYHYARHRTAFGQVIIDYPLVKENLAHTKTLTLAMIASIFHVTAKQDACDITPNENDKLLLRTLVNLNKYFTAKFTVENIHHSIDILAGNGAMESFSTLPRLFRDAIVCENWEGTHYVLWMQILRDIHKSHVDELVVLYLESLVSKLIDHKQTLQQYLNNLKDELASFKTQSLNLQNINIQTIVEKMAALVALISLCLESTSQPDPAKNAAILLFEQMFFTSEKKKDEAYLILLDKVLEGN